MNYLFNAGIDTLHLIPFLLLVYYVIELIEVRWGNIFHRLLQQAGWRGPLLATVLGLIPQCGFSVVITALYVQRLVSLGTLMAVYIATSDEAVPVILAQPGKIMMFLPVLAVKSLLAVVVGYSLDLIFRSHSATAKKDFCVEEHAGCCGHECVPTKLSWASFLHPLWHTLVIAWYLFLVTLGLNILLGSIGKIALQSFLQNNLYFQPFFTALIGLIPNCATSVLLTQTYLNGGLSFAGIVAGLSAAGGLGLIVLVKENKQFWSTGGIIILLYVVSVLAGLLVTLF